METTVFRRFVGPRQYRRFTLWAERFLRRSRVLWLVGFVGFVAVIFFSDKASMQNRLAKVFALTVLPGLSSWLTLNTLACLWGSLLRLRKGGSPLLLFCILLSACAVSLVPAIYAIVLIFAKYR